MCSIVLMKPTKEMEAAALDFKNEHFKNGESVINGSSLFDKTESYDEWLQQLSDSSSKETMMAGWVVGSTFFGVRKEDGRIVGMINIRHELNDYLCNFGGHIGYDIRPSERRKGYMTEMLQQALAYSKEIGLDMVMISCDKENEASRNTILKCGGVLERETKFSEDEILQIYWITTS